MQSFNLGGAKRIIELTINKAKVINAATKLDFVDSDVPSIYARLMVEPYTRMELLWYALNDKGDMKQAAFDEMITGESFKEADKALFDEVAFFIQSLRPEMETVIVELMAKAAKVIEIQTKMIQEVANSPQFDLAMTQALNQMKMDAIENLPTLFTTPQAS